MSDYRLATRAGFQLECHQCFLTLIAHWKHCCWGLNFAELCLVTRILIKWRQKVYCDLGPMFMFASLSTNEPKAFQFKYLRGFNVPTYLRKWNQAYSADEWGLWYLSRQSYLRVAHMLQDSIDCIFYLFKYKKLCKRIKVNECVIKNQGNRNLS